MNDDGSGIVQLTGNERRAPAAWVYDGSASRFTPIGNGSWDICHGRRWREHRARRAGRLPRLVPDGSKIAFRRIVSGTSQIFVMNGDGTGVTQLTGGPGGSTPAWSPDGTRLVFDSDRSGRSEIYLMSADGTGIAQVTTAGGANPDWSLDGTRIVFHATRNRNTDIYAINPDGSREVRLTSSKDTEHSAAWGP
jgi:Tol biopolymer transport system component